MGIEINRDNFVNIIQQGIISGCYRFVRQSTEVWLKKYPKDLLIELYYARGLIGDNNLENSIEILNEITKRDPEFKEAWDLLLQISSKNNYGLIERYIGNLYILGKSIQDFEIPSWAIIAHDCAQVINEPNSFQNKLNPILAEKTAEPLIGIMHLNLAKREQDAISCYQLAKIYHQRWPTCLRISIDLAMMALECGDEASGVSLLHECASNDPAGQVIERVLGKEHEFKSIWVHDFNIILNSPIPSQISIPLGWNRLPAGQPQISSGELSSKPLFQVNYFNEIKNHLHIGKKIPIDKNNQKNNGRDKNENEYLNVIEKTYKTDKLNLDLRAPVYVVLTSKSKLISKYGEKSTIIILDEINKVVEVINLRPGWKALSFIPDEINCMRLFELDTINEIDPWKIKLALVDLDKHLATKGQMIGCVLIVGGHEIIPFHALPNPAEDKDFEILSDNPYSTLDANYLVPEWPVGRLPDETNNDPGILLKQIRLIVQKHRRINSLVSWTHSIQAFFLGSISLGEILRDLVKRIPNYGYSAAVWRRSSLAAFRPIGTGNHLRISPPLYNDVVDFSNLKKAKWAYFNLHGLSETSDWYGQRDLTEISDGPDFPVALSASQFKPGDPSPEVVFSEACYGGLITNKNSDDSIALKMKDQGVIGFIGSTCISYGSIHTPLIGADLLAYLFWNYLKDGLPIGQAFIQAKIGLVKVMTQRQGYLDAEDQKTIISFTLFGDPLLLTERIKGTIKDVIRQKTVLQVNSITDQDGMEENKLRIPGEALEKLKAELKEYLPNLENATVKIKHHQISFENQSQAKSGMENKAVVLTNRTMITYSKHFTLQKVTHHQFVRATLDDRGKMIKLAVSR